VAIDTLADMETLFDGIDLEDVTVSMTINSTGPIALAMYLVFGPEAGSRLEEDPGTLQNDILKEYIAQKEYIFPPRPSMRLITDTFRFCAENVPKYNPPPSAAITSASPFRLRCSSWPSRFATGWSTSNTESAPVSASTTSRRASCRHPSEFSGRKWAKRDHSPKTVTAKGEMEILNRYNPRCFREQTCTGEAEGVWTGPAV
jgi:hypothetical protein